MSLRTSTVGSRETAGGRKRAPRAKKKDVRGHASAEKDAGNGSSGAAKRAYLRRTQRAQASGVEPGVLPRQRRSVMSARIPFVATIIGLVGCGIVLTLLLTTGAAGDSYKLGRARDINQKLMNERALLQREVESADSAPDLAARARKLGMIPAKDPAHLVVAPDGSVTVVGKPVPAQGQPVPLLNKQLPDTISIPTPIRSSPLNGAPNTGSGVQQGTSTNQQLPVGGDVRAQGEQLVPVPIGHGSAVPVPVPSGHGSAVPVPSGHGNAVPQPAQAAPGAGADANAPATGGGAPQATGTGR